MKRIILPTLTAFALTVGLPAMADDDDGPNFDHPAQQGDMGRQIGEPTFVLSQDDTDSEDRARVASADVDAETNLLRQQGMARAAEIHARIAAENDGRLAD